MSGPTWRAAMRQIVAENSDIDVVIVHHATGDNDFFSSKPEVESCERQRVIQMCKDIIAALEATPPKTARCPDPPMPPPGQPSPRCGQRYAARTTVYEDYPE